MSVATPSPHGATRATATTVAAIDTTSAADRTTHPMGPADGASATPTSSLDKALRLDRRRFQLAGGALVCWFALAPRAALGQGEGGSGAPPARPGLPGSLAKAPHLDSWIAVEASGAVTVLTGKAELGQGIKTALIQIAAEELALPPARIRLVTADTARTANEGYTAGSHSMQDSGTAIRHAAAQVRALLAARAAERLAVPAASLVMEDGAFRDPASTRRIGYGEVAAGTTLHVEAAPQSAFVPHARHRVAGTPLPRVDIPAKVTGVAAYVQDLRLPGMLHGRVVQPPSARAALAAFDASTVERMPGVRRVVRDGRFVGVVAAGEWQAVQAAKALARTLRWSETGSTTPTAPATRDAPAGGANSLAAATRDATATSPAAATRSAPSAATTGASVATASALPLSATRQADPYAFLVGPPTQVDTILERGLATDAPLAFTAEYRRPWQMHASIGPSCAVALLEGGKFTVWSHTQGVFPLRGALAEMLGVPPGTIRVVHAEGSGCYGHNGADDVAADAALLARAVPGVPVRVQWMREDEHAHEPLGPPMVVRLAASLDAAGTGIAAWRGDVWSPPHNTRPGKAGNLLAATRLATPFVPPPPEPLPQPEGGGDRNAIPLYRLPAARVTHRFFAEAPFRSSALRSLGAYLNVFAIESFMDELALAARADPVAFRLHHLDDPRAREVVTRAAAAFGWDAWRRTPTRGRGFAFARYKNLAGYCAIAVDLEVRRDSGELRLRRAVAAVDCGEIVAPDGIANQIEGGIVQSLSWTTMESVAQDGVRVLARDWGGYPVLRFPQVPDRIEVVLVDRPGEPYLGAGEVAQGPAGAAIANALADATGVRVREVPLDRARVRAALAL